VRKTIKCSVSKLPAQQSNAHTTSGADKLQKLTDKPREEESTKRTADQRRQQPKSASCCKSLELINCHRPNHWAKIVIKKLTSSTAPKYVGNSWDGGLQIRYKDETECWRTYRRIEKSESQFVSRCSKTVARAGVQIARDRGRVQALQ
jgi:hypothetical protein